AFAYVRLQPQTLKKLDECNAFFTNGLHGGTPVRKKPPEGGMSQKNPAKQRGLERVSLSGALRAIC
ncbi:hypothetical protein MTP29_10980, partial [Xylella fastidiosa subsp. multiplex]